MATFDEFRKLVDQNIRDIRSIGGEAGSAEQFLLNHLEKLARNSQSSDSAKEVKNAMEAVTRFASDSIEWDSDLMKKVLEISKYHSSLLKDEIS